MHRRAVDQWSDRRAHNPEVVGSNPTCAMSYHERRLARKLQDPEFAQAYWAALFTALGINPTGTPVA